MRKSIAIDEKTQEQLKKLCKKHDIKQGEFVSLAVDFYLKADLDPKSGQVNVKREIETMHKRINQLVAFIRTFEKEQMLPLLKEVNTTNSKLDTLPAQMNAFKEITLDQTDMINKQTAAINKNNDTIKALGETIFKRLDSIFHLLKNLFLSHFGSERQQKKEAIAKGIEHVG